MIGILLTVPHGGPGNDTGAAPVAQALHRLLQKTGLEVRTIINRAPRDTVDMNRPEGRGTAFRNAIGTLVQKETVGLLIDVHSFPAGTSRFGDRDIVLLATEDVQTPAFYARYVDLLREGAEKLGCADVDVSVMPAEYVDDVVIHANELGQPPSRLMLAEHNADGPADLYAGMHLYAIGALFGAEEVEQAEYVDEGLHEGVIDGVITWFRKHAKRLDQQWNELPKLLARAQNARAVAVRARPWPWLKFYIFKSPRADCQPFQLSYFKHDEPVGHDCVPSIAAGLTKVWKTWGALEVDGIVESLHEAPGACRACHAEVAVEQEGDLCSGCREAAAEPKTGVQMGEPSVINKPFDFRHEPHAPDSRSVAKTDPTGYHGQHLPKGAEITLATGATKRGERRR